MPVPGSLFIIDLDVFCVCVCVCFAAGQKEVSVFLSDDLAGHSLRSWLLVASWLPTKSLLHRKQCKVVAE